MVLHFIFNTHYLLCEEEFIENNNVKENSYLNYLYYGALIIIGTLFIYSLTISLYPDLDAFKLLDTPSSNNIEFASRYGFHSIAQNPCEKNNIFIHYVDPVIHEKLALSLSKVTNENKILTEQNIILLDIIKQYQTQISDLLQGFDFKSNLENYRPSSIYTNLQQTVPIIGGTNTISGVLIHTPIGSEDASPIF